ncbi:hypothetical protein Cni_G23700 [Canna indica]|uniref:Uncharacterized protein n=1 Tax=Canna indica TaxID=4628 RepID=A0AAQ3KUC2_9LILI|nr:hypothetical protein Cni_G23700 [Canna indica]
MFALGETARRGGRDEGGGIADAGEEYELWVGGVGRVPAEVEEDNGGEDEGGDLEEEMAVEQLAEASSHASLKPFEAPLAVVSLEGIACRLQIVDASGLLPLVYKAIIRYKNSEQAPNVGTLLFYDTPMISYIRLPAYHSGRLLSSDIHLFPSSPRPLPTSAAPQQSLLWHTTSHHTA